MGNIFCLISLSCFDILSRCWDYITRRPATYVGLEEALKNPSPSWDGNFDDATTAEILSRLPVKSLVRFRCVCKSWLALITDPHFARNYNTSRLKLLETINPTRSIDFKAILEDDDRLEYTVPPKAPILWVLGSCNGLICREEVKGGDLILWNPSTRDTYKLPEQINTKTRCFWGFGYDSTNEDYKIVLGLKTEIKVFTLKTGEWKIVEHSMNIGRLRGLGCLLNGALHWVDESGYSTFRIISFDLAEEKFQELPQPNISSNEDLTHLNIGKTIGNRLYLDLYDQKSHRSGAGTAITIWEMSEYGVNGSWARVVEIPSSSLSKQHIFFYIPILVLEDGRVLMNRISNRSNWKQLVCYDPKEDRQKKYRRLVHDYHCAMPILYQETLVLPKPKI